MNHLVFDRLRFQITAEQFDKKVLRLVAEPVKTGVVLQYMIGLVPFPVKGFLQFFTAVQLSGTPSTCAHHPFQATLPIASDEHQGIAESIQTGFQQQRAVQHDEQAIRILVIPGQQSGAPTTGPRMEKRFQLAALCDRTEYPIRHRFPVNPAGIFENLLSPPTHQRLHYFGLGQFLAVEAIGVDLRRPAFHEKLGDR